MLMRSLSRPVIVQNLKQTDLQSQSNSVEFNRVSHRSKTFPTWAFLSLAANGLLMLAVILLLKDYWWPSDAQVSASTTQTSLLREAPKSVVQLGPRHQLSYDRWVAILAQEAKAVASNRPEHLNVLAGDSLSLWFPPDLLPTDKAWLNQGISGETSQGLLKRLNLFDRTKPETIFVMIGINDLIRGFPNDTIFWHYRLIIRRLRRMHPQSEIVVQSILPHGGEETTWQGRDRLLAVPNSRIREINQQLEVMAREEGVEYFDLHPLFTNEQGNLRQEFSTDGLHLSRQGYIVWRSALQAFSQLKRKQHETTPVSPATTVEQSGNKQQQEKGEGKLPLKPQQSPAVPVSRF